MISVIIPAYNAEKTIERAITSAIKQIPDCEVIVVENGSSDNTYKTVQEISKQYFNVILIHSEKGVSKARNAGIELAKGSWIMFLDADDFFEESTRHVIEKSSVSSIDLWLFGHKAGKNIKKVSNANNDQYFLKEEVVNARVLMMVNPTRYMQVWGKLFKGEIIKRNHICFNEKLELSEDSDFTLKYIKNCQSICFSPEVIYHYSVDNCSTMRSSDRTKIDRYLLAMTETQKEISGESSTIKNAFAQYVLMHFNIAMVRDVFAETIENVPYKNRKNIMKKLAKEDIFADAIKKTKIRSCVNLRMVPILFLKIRCYDFSALVYQVRVKQNMRRERAK